jgi:hypothetical protein
MFTQILRHSYFFFILVSVPQLVSAEVFKWVDEHLVTHYSEQAPRGYQYEVIKDPPPPAIDPAVAQKEVDMLIEKQQGTFEAKEEERRLAKETKAKQEERQKYCESTKQTLKKYQDNPGRRMLDQDGNVIEPNEEQRQQKISDLKQDIEKNCSKGE